MEQPGLDNLSWTLSKPATMTSYNGEMWRNARGLDDAQIYTSSSRNGAWQWRGLAGLMRSSHGPALAVHDNKMWLFLRGTDGALWAATYDRDWSSASPVAGNRLTLMDEPSSASHGGNLYVMYRR
ncbi:hypothetical protein ACFV98_17975 [Streptomyces violascens]|uniref:hypothetical protein n=1 Tax=Streptomyces violascens TaxID=67381 RepID=UPI00364F3673